MPLIAVGHGKFAVADDEDWGYLTFYFGSWELAAGYPSVKKNGKRVTMHKVVAKRMRLDISRHIDHKDTDKLNCRRNNLRSATPSQNLANARLSSLNTTGHKGICWDHNRQKWRAMIRVNGKLINLISTDSKDEAIAAYKVAADKYHGEFARYS